MERHGWAVCQAWHVRTWHRPCLSHAGHGMSVLGHGPIANPNCDTKEPEAPGIIFKKVSPL